MPSTQPTRTGRFLNGEAVKAIRELSGVSQLDLAKMLGYRDATYLSKLETGIIQQPSAALVNRLAQALNVPAAAISFTAPVLCDHEAVA